jgi:hypothetical protein
LLDKRARFPHLPESNGSEDGEVLVNEPSTYVKPAFIGPGPAPLLLTRTKWVTKRTKVDEVEQPDPRLLDFAKVLANADDEALKKYMDANPGLTINSTITVPVFEEEEVMVVEDDAPHVPAPPAKPEHAGMTGAQIAKYEKRLEARAAYEAKLAADARLKASVHYKHLVPWCKQLYAPPTKHRKPVKNTVRFMQHWESRCFVSGYCWLSYFPYGKGEVPDLGEWPTLKTLRDALWKYFHGQKMLADAKPGRCQFEGIIDVGAHSYHVGHISHSYLEVGLGWTNTSKLSRRVGGLRPDAAKSSGKARAGLPSRSSPAFQPSKAALLLGFVRSLGSTIVKLWNLLVRNRWPQLCIPVHDVTAAFCRTCLSCEGHSVDEPGYCYLRLFPSRLRPEVSQELGPIPQWSDIQELFEIVYDVPIDALYVQPVTLPDVGPSRPSMLTYHRGATGNSQHATPAANDRLGSESTLSLLSKTHHRDNVTMPYAAQATEEREEAAAICPWTTTPEQKRLLNDEGIPCALASDRHHKHVVHKAIERSLHQSAAKKLAGPFVAMQMKQSKFDRLRRESGQPGTLVNVAYSARDCDRFPGAPDSLPAHLPASTVFLDGTLQQMSLEDFADLTRQYQNVDTWLCLIISPYETKFRSSSVYPQTYRLIYPSSDNSKFLYSLEGKDDDNYEQPINHLQWLETAVMHVESEDQVWDLTFTRVESHLTQHLVLVKRGKLPTERLDALRSPHLVELPAFGAALRTRWVQHSTYLQCMSHAFALKNYSRADAYAKLRSYIKEHFPVLDMRTVHHMCALLVCVRSHDWSTAHLPPDLQPLSWKLKQWWSNSCAAVLPRSIHAHLFGQFYQLLASRSTLEPDEAVFLLTKEDRFVRPKPCIWANGFTAPAVRDPEPWVYHERAVARAALLPREQPNQAPPPALEAPPPAGPAVVNPDDSELGDRPEDEVIPDRNAPIDHLEEIPDQNAPEWQPELLQFVQPVHIPVVGDHNRHESLVPPDTCLLRAWEALSQQSPQNAWNVLRANLPADYLEPGFQPHIGLSSRELHILASVHGFAVNIQYYIHQDRQPYWVGSAAEGAPTRFISWTREPRDTPEGRVFVGHWTALPNTTRAQGVRVRRACRGIVRGAADRNVIPERPLIQHRAPFRLDFARLFRPDRPDPPMSHPFEYQADWSRAKMCWTGWLRSEWGKAGEVLPRGEISELQKMFENRQHLNHRVTVSLNIGAPGSGKSHSIKQWFHRYQEKLAFYWQACFARVQLMEDWKTGASDKGKRLFKTLEKAPVDNVALLHIEELQMYPPGYLDMRIILCPDLRLITATGDCFQSGFTLTTTDSPLQTQESDLLRLLPRAGPYKLYTHRLAPGIARPLGLDTTSQAAGRFHVINYRIKGIWTLVPQTYKADGANVGSTTFASSTGVDVRPGADYQIILDHAALHKCSHEVIFSALTRGPANVYIVNELSPSDRQAANGHPVWGPVLGVGTLDVSRAFAARPTEFEALPCDWITGAINYDELDPAFRALWDEKPSIVREIRADSFDPQIRTHFPHGGPDMSLAELEPLVSKESQEYSWGLLQSDQIRDVQKNDGLTNFLFAKQSSSLDPTALPKAVQRRMRFKTREQNLAHTMARSDLGTELFSNFLEVCPLPQDSFTPELFEACQAENYSKKIEKGSTLINNTAARYDPDSSFNSAKIFLKTQDKAKWESLLNTVKGVEEHCRYPRPKGSEIKPGQTLALFPDQVLELFGPIARGITRLIKDHLPSRVLWYGGVSLFDLEDWTRDNYRPGPKFTCDFTAYDQSCTGETLWFEIKLLRHIGVPEELVSLYWEQKINLQTTFGHSAVMRFTGEPWTFVFNTAFNMAYMWTRYDLANDQSCPPQCFAGDDSLFYSRLEERASWPFYAERFTLVGKTLLSDTPDFCGWWLYPTIVRNPLLLRLKLLYRAGKGRLRECIDSFFLEAMFAYRGGDSLWDHVPIDFLEHQRGVMDFCYKRSSLVPHLYVASAPPVPL